MSYLFWQNSQGTLHGVSQEGPDQDGYVMIFTEDGERIKVNTKEGWQIITPELLLREMGRRIKFTDNRVDPIYYL